MKVTKKAVEARIGPIRAAEWRAIEHALDDPATGWDVDVDAAGNLVRQLREEDQARDRERRPTGAAPRSTTALESRGMALGAWARNQVRSNLKVTRWRRRNGLFLPEDLHSHVFDHLNGAAAEDGVRAGAATLEWYELVGGNVVWHASLVPAGSHLDELAQLAAALAPKHRMMRPDMCQVIACDVVRPVEPLITRVERVDQVGGRRSESGPLSRLVLEVDPMTPPEVVAEVYRRQRTEWFPGRRRVMSDRVMRLAGFMANEELTFEGPRWRYARSFLDIEQDWMAVSDEPRNPNFARDARRAVRTLLAG